MDNYFFFPIEIPPVNVNIKSVLSAKDTKMIIIDRCLTKKDENILFRKCCTNNC